jgi:hypothetical protein
MVLSSGCAGTASLKATPASTSATPIPWISATPTPYIPATPSPAALPPGTPACKASQLVAVFGGSGALTGGQLMGTIDIGNRGPAACFLEGFAVIRLFDSNSAPIPVQILTWTEPKPARVLVQPETINLSSYSQIPGSASVSFIWPTHDGTGTCSPAAREGTLIRVDLPSGAGTLVVPVRDPRNQVTIASCGGRLSIGPFESVQPSVPATPAPTRLAISLDVPHSVAAGQILRYTVRLRNISSEPFLFDTGCPGYIQSAIDQGQTRAFAKELYLLNCASITEIEPQAAAVFAMQLNIPTSVEPATYLVYWNLIGFDAPPAGHGSFLVTR